MHSVATDATIKGALRVRRGAGIDMPRIKTESLQTGMVVASDVKNLDSMLLIPAGCALTERQISILQAWGIGEVEVETAANVEEPDPLSRLAPEVLMVAINGFSFRGLPAGW